MTDNNYLIEELRKLRTFEATDLEPQISSRLKAELLELLEEQLQPTPQQPTPQQPTPKKATTGGDLAEELGIAMDMGQWKLVDFEVNSNAPEELPTLVANYVRIKEKD